MGEITLREAKGSSTQGEDIPPKKKFEEGKKRVAEGDFSKIREKIEFQFKGCLFGRYTAFG